MSNQSTLRKKEQSGADGGDHSHLCCNCGLSYATKAALKVHARMHCDVDDSHHCKVCHKTFAKPARLVCHYRTHSGEKPFECEYCHKMFSEKGNLQVHRRIHTKERPFRCNVCEAAFDHAGKLSRHIKIHTGERPHACPYCPKKFIQKGQMQIHVRSHTGERPYRCHEPGCLKDFVSAKMLNIHTRYHTGELPYTCVICLRGFRHSQCIKYHHTTHNKVISRCSVCDKEYKSKKIMEKHMYNKHGAQGDAVAAVVGPTPPATPLPDQSGTALPRTASPQLPPPTHLQMSFPPLSLPLRKRQHSTHVEPVPAAPVRPTVIQYAPPRAADSSHSSISPFTLYFFYLIL